MGVTAPPASSQRHTLTDAVRVGIHRPHRRFGYAQPVLGAGPHRSGWVRRRKWFNGCRSGGKAAFRPPQPCWPILPARAASRA
eukprot:3462883-Prymnesium_polylepis.1